MKTTYPKKLVASIVLVILSMLHITVTASQITPYTSVDNDIVGVSNFRGDANLSNDTTHIAPISLSEGGETISNDYENAQPPKESLSNFTFPEVQTRSTTSAIEVSGLIDASTLEDNAELVLTGNTNLFMDVNKTLKCIRGDYTLTLSGGNILTLNNPEDYAINVLSITISAPLIVKESNVAISAKNGITINSNR